MLRFSGTRIWAANTPVHGARFDAVASDSGRGTFACTGTKCISAISNNRSDATGEDLLVQRCQERSGCILHYFRIGDRGISAGSGFIFIKSIGLRLSEIMMHFKKSSHVAFNLVKAHSSWTVVETVIWIDPGFGKQDFVRTGLQEVQIMDNVKSIVVLSEIKLKAPLLGSGQELDIEENEEVFSVRLKTVKAFGEIPGDGKKGRESDICPGQKVLRGDELYSLSRDRGLAPLRGILLHASQNRPFVAYPNLAVRRQVRHLIGSGGVTFTYQLVIFCVRVYG